MRKIFLLLFIISNIILVNAQTDTITTESGLKYIVVEKGNGEKADTGKAVEVHYTGYLLNGKVFDSSRQRGEPIEFVLGAGQVIKGWDEGIRLMNIGDQYKLIIPSNLAYGERGAGDLIPPGSTLIFDVELMSVSKPKPPIGDIVLEEMVFKGIDSAIAKYYYLKENHPDEYNFKESQLNTLGYQLLQGGHPDRAMIVLCLNAEAYPESFNVYDSLAEACMVAGENELAIENYKKSLELNPENKNAEDMLKKLAEK